MNSILRIFWIGILLMSVCPLSAQNSATLNGVLQDSITREGVVGAVIEAAPVAQPDKKKYQTSTLEGQFSLKGLAYGDYTLTISFLGYKTVNYPVKIDRKTVDIGVIEMQPEAQELEEVVVTGTAMRTSAKGDTIIYNADAFKVTQDASTEQLLSKMPGVRVVDGTVEAHGETVQKVLVDGKEFFGDDVTTAIKNLPAEVIDKVEVFNKLSDQAEFSGVDDGEGYKALNIVTRNKMNRGSFGRFYAGYGFNDKYNLGASLNLFNDKRRISIIGMANNINEQNFATDDILGVMGASTSDGGGQRRGGSGANFMVPTSKGVSTIYSLGINYSEKFSEKVKLDASYFFNTNRNETQTLTDRSYYMTEEETQYYDAESDRNTRNYNHRFNARLDYRINENNSLMWRPRISLQTNDATSQDTSSQYLGATALEKALLNIFNSASSTHTEGYNISNSLVYMHKFGEKKGRLLTTFLNANFSKNDSDQDKYSLTRYYNPDSESLLDQYIRNHSKSYRLNGNIMYSEPISPRSQLLISYRISYNYSDRDKRTYEMPDEEFLDEYSNTYNSGYLTHSVGPGYRYQKGKSMLVANVFYQASSLTGDQIFPSTASPSTSAHFNNVTYMGMLNLQFNPSTTLRTMLRSSTNNPSVTQLQDVLDISNPLFVSQGNPTLRPVYSHRLYMNFVKANTEKGRTFIASLGGTAQSNYIANSVQLADKNNYEVKDEAGNVITVLDQGAQYSRPVNLDGYWSVNGSLSYGAPIKFLRSNLNVNGTVKYSVLPGVFNLQPNKTNTVSYIGGATLGSNISEKVDFTFSYNVGYNIASNAVRPQSDNEYVNQSATGRFKWITWGGITLQATANYSKYTGVTDQFTEEFLLLNASLGKKLFKGQRGEINVTVNDLLNQNKSFARNVTDAYIENVTSNVIGRYVSINFVYNLRRFGGKTVDSIPAGKGGPDMLRPGGFGGPPPGGPPPPPR